MAGNGMFRTALLGGYNKDDVEEYIGTLERELEAVKVSSQKEKNELLRKIEERNENTGDEKRFLELQRTIETLRQENEDLYSRLKDAENFSKTDENGAVMQQEPLEKENIMLQADNEALKARIIKMEEEMENLRKEQSGDFFDYETVNKIMEEARRNASEIEEKSRVKAEQMIKEAREETEKQKEIIVRKINAQLEEKGIQLLAAKYKMEQYAKDLDNAQQGLYDLNTRVKKMVENMPVRLDDYWEGEYYRSLEVRKTEKPEKTLEQTDRENNVER